MKRKRRNHSAEFKAKVALDARSTAAGIGFVNGRQQRLQDGPLTIGEVAGVALDGHGRA